MLKIPTRTSLSFSAQQWIVSILMIMTIKRNPLFRTTVVHDDDAPNRFPSNRFHVGRASILVLTHSLIFQYWFALS